MPTVDGWERLPAEDGGPEEGYIATYRLSDQAIVSVFIYRRGVPNITRDEAMLRREVEAALTGMERAVVVGRYESVVATSPVQMRRLDPRGGPPLAAYQHVTIRVRGAHQVSETYVTTHRGFFFKVRVTIHVEPTPRIGAAVDRLLVALARIATE
jgi:hypothetical protein